MKIITVSGSQSGAGKTRVAEKLLRVLKGWSALKVTVSHNGACPIKKDCGVCAGLSKYFSLISARKIIEQEGKDTQRLKSAGAKEVFWLKTRPEGLRQGLKKAIATFKKTPGIIIEGNSTLKYLNPDLAIFVKNKALSWKPSARQIINKIDWFLTL